MCRGGRDLDRERLHLGANFCPGAQFKAQETGRGWVYQDGFGACTVIWGDRFHPAVRPAANLSLLKESESSVFVIESLCVVLRCVYHLYFTVKK